MINSKTLFSDFVKQITLPAEKGEVESISHLVFQQYFGISRGDILLGKEIAVTEAKKMTLQHCIDRLNMHEPIQYILGQADFFGRTFDVNSSVLIPRPETEELVHEVVKAAAKLNPSITRILDIGTGSGCIPISLSLEIKKSQVFATDISEAALTVAKQNAIKLNGNVEFVRHDILTADLPFNNLDYIVSNPPYITMQEANQMSKNVLDYEPHLALFADGDDPLIFYRVISQKAIKALNEGGSLLMEINSSFGRETKAILESAGFTNVSVIKDISGNDRIVKAVVR